MGLSKAEAIRQLGGNVSNQEALVKKIKGTQAIEPVRRVIPAGKTMHQTLDKSKLPNAVFTWLRHCRHFTEATISLSRDYTTHSHSMKRVVDFDTNTKNVEWEVRGKRWLAERVADVIWMDDILAVEITKEGIYGIFDKKKAFNPQSEDWEPYIELTPFKPPTF